MKALRYNLRAFPADCANEWERLRAVALYNSIREANEELLKQNLQLDDIRLSQRERFDLIKEAEQPSTSGIRTPIRSYSGTARKSAQPRKPEVIDLDLDESVTMAVCESPVTPRPKRNRLVHQSFVCGTSIINHLFPDCRGVLLMTTL